MESILPLSTRMIVSFRSNAFNTSTPEKHFVSPRSYGSDLANWLTNELAQRHAATQPAIAQKDAGWVVRFRLRRASYDFGVRFRDPEWVGFLERRRGFVGRVFHQLQKNVEPDALMLVDSMLSSSELISDVRWAFDESADAT